MNSRIEIGHVSRFWNDDFKSLPYVKQPITDEEIHKWQSQGYDYVKSFSGSMYDNRNPMPDWIQNLNNLFGMHSQTYTVYRMDTLEIMPPHSDHFNTYCRLHNTTYDKVQRAVMMLEDWKPGHYFELDGVGYVNWKAGDWFKWTGDVVHAASNIGTEPRYTLQITGIPVAEGQLNKLFYHNIPNIEDNCTQPFVKNDVLPKVSEQHVMIYMNNRFIHELTDIDHSVEARNKLNDEGLHIYLYEPLSCYDRNNPDHTMGFYSEFYSIEPENLGAEELDSISHYAIRNSLTNVTVHTCDYDVQAWYPYYSNINLVCDDLFLKTQKKIRGLDETFRNQFNQKFVCLNWRFTNHRQLVALFLANEDGYLSWYHKTPFRDLDKNLFFDFYKWGSAHTKHFSKLKKNCDIVNSNPPYIVDIPANHTEVSDNVNIWPNAADYKPGETPALRNIVSNSLSAVYTNAFVDVINETRFAQPTANFSEKVFQAIQYKKPFIVVAPPKTLEYIRTFGFRTFNDFWDESYDETLNHGERLAKIFDLLEKINNMSVGELREMYDDMRNIVEHNFKVYKEFVK